MPEEGKVSAGHPARRRTPQACTISPMLRSLLLLGGLRIVLVSHHSLRARNHHQAGKSNFQLTCTGPEFLNPLIRQNGGEKHYNSRVIHLFLRIEKHLPPFLVQATLYHYKPCVCEQSPSMTCLPDGPRAFFLHYPLI